jgi:type VI protein secretion system component VasK
MDGKGPDRRAISIGESALWDERLDAFRVKAQGNRDVTGVVILRWARLPISHLDSSTPHKKTRLGQNLRERLEVEINAAITRGDRTVSEGLKLLSSDDEAKA